MSSDAATLKKVVKRLQSTSTNADITTILQTLKKDFVVNETILRESKAGLAVGKLRQHASKEVSDLAKELVKKWKNEVEKGKNLAGGSAAGQKTVGRKASTASVATPVTPTSSKPETRRATTDGVNLEVTGDPTRDKCVELIYDALASDSGAPSDRILQKAVALEDAVQAEFQGAQYKSKIRSLFMNLKDKKNPGLRESVISGDLDVKKLPTMSSADMASAERKAEIDKIKQDNMFAALGAEEQQAETDAFQCSRCKQRKCRYRQAQTRSADEPMTTFVTCVNCNNRWKFS